MSKFEYVWQDWVLYRLGSAWLGPVQETLKVIFLLCRSILSNQSLQDVIESLHFDLMVIDGDPTTRQFMMIPYKLNVPFIALSAWYV